MERVAGGSITSSGGRHILSSEILDINPVGRLNNTENVHAIAGSTEEAEAILDQMEAKVRDVEDHRHLTRSFIHVRGVDRV